MGSKPPQTRKGQQGFPFQTLPHEPETAGRKAAQVRLKRFRRIYLQNSVNNSKIIVKGNEMAAVLEWAGIAENGRGELILTNEYRSML